MWRINNFLNKNWLLVVLPIATTVLVFLFGQYFRYIIFAAIAIAFIYFIFRSTILTNYVGKNWYILVGLALAVGWGMYNKEKIFWKDFEEASILMTLIYTAFLYIKMFWDDKIDKGALKAALPALVGGMVFIFISGFSSVMGDFHIGSSGFKLISIPGSRDVTLGLLCLGTFFYCIVNYSLSKTQTTYKDVFVKSLQYSDFPVFITFLILWSTTVPFRNDLHNPVLEAFYGGTIAFQMIYSNIVWSFIDDPIIEKHFNNNTKIK